MLHKICFKLNGWKLNLQNGNCMIYTEGVSKVDVISMLESLYNNNSKEKGKKKKRTSFEKIVTFYSDIMPKVLRLIPDRICFKRVAHGTSFQRFDYLSALQHVALHVYTQASKYTLMFNFNTNQ
uniref:Uncharacterized protein n=1 Tax=Glossina austeni TaxID=7395 RepID=A0A1A9VND9_GLOAU